MTPGVFELNLYLGQIKEKGCKGISKFRHSQGLVEEKTLPIETSGSNIFTIISRIITLRKENT